MQKENIKKNDSSRFFSKIHDLIKYEKVANFPIPDMISFLSSGS